MERWESEERGERLSLDFRSSEERREERGERREERGEREDI